MLCQDGHDGPDFHPPGITFWHSEIIIMLDLEKKDIAFADTAEAGWKRIRKDDKCLPI